MVKFNYIVVNGHSMSFANKMVILNCIRQSMNEDLESCCSLE